MISRGRALTAVTQKLQEFWVKPVYSFRNTHIARTPARLAHSFGCPRAFSELASGTACVHAPAQPRVTYGLPGTRNCGFTTAHEAVTGDPCGLTVAMECRWLSSGMGISHMGTEVPFLEFCLREL